MKMKSTIYLLFFIFISISSSQAIPINNNKPEREEWFHDMGLGLFIHWSFDVQLGSVISHSLVGASEEFRKDYFALHKSFNPTNFDPDNWAALAKLAGFQYVVFTTKHHNGFCMFDTQQTGYKITSADCPFHNNPKANILSHVFDAFRKQDFMIGAYFSKPDWNCEHYWWPYYATPDRHVNYDPAKHPDKWQKFKDFTYFQIEELMSEYGQVDILWLDGAWVRPKKNMPKGFEDWAQKKRLGPGY